MITLDVSASILEAIREDDKSESRFVARVAERIVAKGFELSFFTNEPGVREGFRWGRSSYGVTTRRVWTIHFTDKTDTEHAVCVVVQNVSYTKANPYDRIPKGNGESYRVQATDTVKAVLGWREQFGASPDDLVIGAEHPDRKRYRAIARRHPDDFRL